MDNIWDKLTIIKELGHGMYGTTYLVKDSSGNQYALKREHILKSDLHKSTKSIVWREIQFAETFGDHPDHFTKLYAYRIIKKCKHKQKYSTNPSQFNEDIAEKYKKLAESPYCIEKLYDFKDGITLEKAIEKHIISDYKSISIQLAYIIYLMMDRGFIHNDLHWGNIMLVKTNKKTINILGKEIPTGGYLVVAIDYGTVLSKKFKLNKEEKEMIHDNNDFFTIILMLANIRKFWKYIEKNKIKEKDYELVASNLMKTREFEGIKKVVKLKTYPPTIVHLLFLLTHPDMLQMEMAGKNFPVKYLIHQKDLLYMLLNRNNPKKILNHFIKQINN